MQSPQLILATEPCPCTSSIQQANPSKSDTSREPHRPLEDETSGAATAPTPEENASPATQPQKWDFDADRTLCDQHRESALNFPAMASVHVPDESASPVTHPQKSDTSVVERKLRLLKRSGLFGTVTSDVTFERACTLEDLCGAYRLVHQVYLGTEFIKPEPGGLRLRVFEASQDTATFVAKVNGRIVGVLGVVIDSVGFGLPSDTAFRNELDGLRASGVRLAEITNQAVAEEFRKSAIPTELMRCVVAHLVKVGVEKTIAAVSPSHNAFYEMLGFRKIGNERSYSDKLHDPVVALAADIQPFRVAPEDMNATEEFVNQFLGRGNPYNERIDEWDAAARRFFLNAKWLCQLFVEERNLIEECTERELDVLIEGWGPDIFSAALLRSSIKRPEPVIAPHFANTQMDCVPTTMNQTAGFSLRTAA